jgi:unsaturated rhamnogalacturonyl hydrolase
LPSLPLAGTKHSADYSGSTCLVVDQIENLFVQTTVVNFPAPWNHGMQLPGKLQNQSRASNRETPRCRGRRILLFVALCGYTASHSVAQTLSSSERIAHAVIADQQGGRPAMTAAQDWTLAKGEQLEGMDAAWYNTANGDYFRFVKRTVDDLLENGTAADSHAGSLRSLDQGLLGGQLLLLYRVTLDPKYYKAATLLRQKLAASCLASSETEPSGGHADQAGAEPCRAEPFLADYAYEFHEAQDFDRITRDFLRWRGIKNLSSRQTTGKHPAQDSSTNDPLLAVALIDTLVSYSRSDPGRTQLVALFRRIAAAVAMHEDSNTGVLYQAYEKAPHAALVPPWFLPLRSVGTCMP